MKSLLVAMAFVSGSAFSQSSIVLPSDNIPIVDDARVPTGVFTALNVLPTNGGINPNFTGVSFEGTIKAGNNSCEASRYSVGIKKLVTKNQIIFKPFVTRKAGGRTSFCPALFDASYPGVSFAQTFVISQDEVSKSIVVDVLAKGRNVALENLLPAEETEVPGEGEVIWTPAGVVTEVTAESTNGGINPSYAGVKFQGLIKVGGNACEGNRYEVSLEMTKEGETTVFVPSIKAKAGMQDIMCPMFLDMNYKGVSFEQSFVLPSADLQNALLKDYEEAGKTIEVQTLLAK